MNVLSLFDGMSCGQIALDRLGVKVDNYYASEIKKHAIAVSTHNYPGTIHLGDVTKWREWKMPKIDIVIGGSPCQDFSRANAVRDGLDGEKSGLAHVLSDIIKELKPKYWLVENVIMGAENVTAMSELFGTRPIRINSSLVSAQLRDRLYWTNIGPQDYDLFGVPTPAMQQPVDRKIFLQDILQDGYTDRSKSRALLESDSRPLATLSKMAHRYITTGFTTIVSSDEETFLRVKEATKIGFVDVGDNQGVDLSYPTSKTRRGRLMKDKSNALLRNNEYFIFKDGDLRYFTQTELERLQTVPEGYTSILSRNKAACLLGDGWTVDVICHILSHMEFL